VNGTRSADWVTLPGTKESPGPGGYCVRRGTRHISTVPLYRAHPPPTPGPVLASFFSCSGVLELTVLPTCVARLSCRFAYCLPSISRTLRTSWDLPTWQSGTNVGYLVALTTELFFRLHALPGICLTSSGLLSPPPCGAFSAVSSRSADDTVATAATRHPLARADAQMFNCPAFHVLSAIVYIAPSFVSAG
jgi:hypothetical protein